MASNDAALIELRDVSKYFGTVIALNGVSFAVRTGEVHCLLGDNGAGKSTLIKILSGVHAPTKGEFLVQGKPVSFASPRDALDAGIATVFQDLATVPLMSVARNFFAGREPVKGWGPLKHLDWDFINRTTREEMARMGIDVRDPGQPVGTLSGGERQSLAIARAVFFGAKVLILDEPTSALGQKQQMEVLKTIQRVRLRGDIAIIFITHNEVHAKLVADRFTFLALGEVIGRGTRADLEGEDIRHLMAGGANISDLQKQLEAVRLSGRAAS